MQFKDIIGHKELKQHFIKEVNEDRISHAQLFLGNSGYGGMALTIAFLQYLFCSNKLENDSCGACSSCKKVQQLQHPDIHFSFPTVQVLSNTSDPQFSEWRAFILENPYFNLNQWTLKSDSKSRRPILSKHQSVEIIKKLSLKSYEGGYKVSVIWLADEMNLTCANKLLKIIEEPPAKTLFILLVEQQEKIMSTILSRTQLLKIKPFTDADIKQHLLNQGVSDGELLNSITARADGNLLKATTLIDTESSINQNRIDFIQLMRICFKKEVLPMLDWAEKMAGYGREEQKNFLLYALYMVRQSLMKNYTNEQLMRASDEEIAFLLKFSRFISGNNVLDFTELFNSSHYHLERNAHGKLLFTTITFEVMRFIHRA